MRDVLLLSGQVLIAVLSELHLPIVFDLPFQDVAALLVDLMYPLELAPAWLTFDLVDSTELLF